MPIDDIKSEAADWQIDSSDPGYQSFTISTSDAPQPCPAFVQCLQYYAPANTMVAEGKVMLYSLPQLIKSNVTVLWIKLLFFNM